MDCDWFQQLIKQEGKMSKRKYIEKSIWWLPISPISKLNLVRIINLTYNIINGNSDLNNNIGVVKSNSYYGHEYWLKKYSHFEKAIYGLIEHGVYFGDNMNIVGDEKEYSVKNIITFGDYREKLIKKAFPKHQVIKIGPRIAYAETDNDFLKQLTNKTNGKKILTLFPAHSLVDCKCTYDVDYLLSNAKEIMNENGIEHLIVCLKEQDMTNGNADCFVNRGCTVVTAGAASIKFLPRLRAIIESSTLTMSNSLGTHLGYCIYLNKPHVLIKQDRIELRRDNLIIDPVNSILKDEENMFAKIFSRNCVMNITDEQYELCDYYWGFEYVKNPLEMWRLLADLHY